MGLGLRPNRNWTTGSKTQRKDKELILSFIQVKNLRKVYHIGSEKVVALNDINLNIERGEILCILGTSGSGKSTLLNMLAGLEKPTRGTIQIGKSDVGKLSENKLAMFRQKHVGFIFQSYNLMPSLTAIENVAMPLMFRGIGKAKRNRLALKMLTEVGLKSRAKHKPTQMSGGQQQRVGIARAFVARPKIVFADEPTGNLDTKTTLDVMSLMVRMSRENNQTFILVTHDKEISLFADRVIHIIDGVIERDEKITPEQRAALDAQLAELALEKEQLAAQEALEREQRKKKRAEAAQNKKLKRKKPPKPPKQPKNNGAQAPPNGKRGLHKLFSKKAKQAQLVGVQAEPSNTSESDTNEQGEVTNEQMQK